MSSSTRAAIAARLTVSPVARSSARARLAQGSRRADRNPSIASRRASRASVRLPARRSRSPWQSCVRAISNGAETARRCSHAMAKQRSSSCSSASSPRQRAAVPSAQRPPVRCCLALEHCDALRGPRRLAGANVRLDEVRLPVHDVRFRESAPTRAGRVPAQAADRRLACAPGRVRAGRAPNARTADRVRCGARRSACIARAAYVAAPLARLRSLRRAAQGTRARMRCKADGPFPPPRRAASLESGGRDSSTARPAGRVRRGRHSGTSSAAGALALRALPISRRAARRRCRGDRARSKHCATRRHRLAGLARADRQDARSGSSRSTAPLPPRVRRRASNAAARTDRANACTPGLARCRHRARLAPSRDALWNLSGEQAVEASLGQHRRGRFRIELANELRLVDQQPVRDV